MRSKSSGAAGAQVQEAAAASEGFLRMPDAQLNLGILALALEKPKEAVQVRPPRPQAHDALLCRFCHQELHVILCIGAKSKVLSLPLSSGVQRRLQLFAVCHCTRRRSVEPCVGDLNSNSWRPAAQIFSAVLRKYFSGASAEVLLLLARAFYDAEQMPQARQALLRAVHLDPTNMQLRFNVALVLQVRL